MCKAVSFRNLQTSFQQGTFVEQVVLSMHSTTILNTFSCIIFLSLFVVLFASKSRDSTFSAWTEHVVLGGGSNMSTTITSANASLMNFCHSSNHPTARFALPPISFSMNDTRFTGTVFVSKHPFTANPRDLLAIVLSLSFAFHLWRIHISLQEMTNLDLCFSKIESNISPNDSYSPCRRTLPDRPRPRTDPANLRLMTDNYIIGAEGYYMPSESFRYLRKISQSCAPPYEHTLQPDFLRWLEYTLTSPLQIIVICSTVYIRNISDITQLSALQAALTLLGWTLEILISNLEHCNAYMPTTGDEYQHHFYDNLKKFFLLFLFGLLFHIVIWWNILSRYLSHVQNIAECDFGILGLPPIIGNMLVVQCILFSLFGCIPLMQVSYIAFVQNSRSTSSMAALAYNVLSILSKGILASMFVKLITDDSCVQTSAGEACLY